MQVIKKEYNYDQLLYKVKKLPEILSGCQDTLQEIVYMATAELKDESKLRVIHGDFWTGK